MTALDPIAHFGLLVRPQFFDEEKCTLLGEEMRMTETAPATVYSSSSSGAVQENVRRTLRHTLSPKTIEYVRRRLVEFKPDVERHFNVSLSHCEEPQFLRYRVGDFFVAHQDGNTGLLQLATESRRVSVVIFLNQQSDTQAEGDYCGGSLVFHDWRVGQVNAQPFHMAGEAGTFVAFRSETTHEVIPVTFGERFSIACWYI